MVAKCPKCGFPLVKSARVCTNCGESLCSEHRPEAITIFYSYSHKDESFRQELEAHLAALRRSGVIREWYDRKLTAGQDWGQEVSRHLETAEIVLFLISADFLNSSYVSDIEVKRALERQDAGQAVVVPVILRPTVWRIVPEFSRLQALPQDARPVTEWSSHDLAFVSVCEGILAVVLARASAHSSQAPIIGAEDIHLKRPTISRSRRRILDAAIPKQVPISEPSTLLVMIRRTDSSGLRGVVEADPTFEVAADEVKSHCLSLAFPRDARGTPQPAELTVRVESPQFWPASQIKTLSVPPRGDSPALVFLVTPRERGPLMVNLEVCRGNDIIAGCVLRTSAGQVTGAGTETKQSVTSASFEVWGADEEPPASEAVNEGLERMLLIAFIGLPLLGLLIYFRDNIAAKIQDAWAYVSGTVYNR